MEFSKKEYSQYVKEMSPNSPFWKDLFNAFWIGGLICVVGQMILNGFTAMGQVQMSLPLSFWRKLVYFSAIFALPALFGAEAILYAEPISDVIGPLVTAAAYALSIRRILRRREQELINDHLGDSVCAAQSK